MLNAVIASTAFMATSALATGVAHVVNSCSYEVYMANTPAQGGGFEPINEVLSPGDSYSQEWTQLGNDMGWSIKLAKTDNYQSDLMQYEYTYHNDGIIWYDLSEVDGNPWDGNWMIEGSGSCSPKQQAYRYATDDAYGMQSCPASSEITVTLCSGDSGSGSSSSEPEASQAASSEVAPEPTSFEAATSTEAQAAPTSTEDNNTWGGWQTRGADKKAAEITPSPTTMITQKVSVANTDGYDVTVTNVATEVVTAYVTAAPGEQKRHEHHPRHPHMRREE